MQIKRTLASSVMSHLWTRLKPYFPGRHWYPYQTTKPPTLAMLLSHPNPVGAVPSATDIAHWAILSGFDEGGAALRLAADREVQAAILSALARDETWLSTTHSPFMVKAQLIAWARSLRPVEQENAPFTLPPFLGS